MFSLCMFPFFLTAPSRSWAAGCPLPRPHRQAQEEEREEGEKGEKEEEKAGEAKSRGEEQSWLWGVENAQQDPEEQISQSGRLATQEKPGQEE